MDHVVGLACTACGATHDPDAVTYTCPEHGRGEGVLSVRYDYDRAEAGFDPGGDHESGGVWRYRPLLPVPGDADPVTLGEGGTPLLAAPDLGRHLGVDLLVKDEGCNPTGSAKDRASSVVATRAVAGDHGVVTCASTGNAAASLAGYAARAGLDCRIFVPADAPAAKLAQPRTYGADVVPVDGSYADAYEVCLAATERRGWYNRSAAVNPYAVEGTRTLGFELAGHEPDWVALSMGNGCTLAGCWKGLDTFDRLGYADGTPKLLGVQAAGVAPIHDRFHGRERADERARDGADGTGDGEGTLADSIAVETPHNAAKACRALEASGGTSVTVTDEELLAAQRRLGGTAGVYAEPAGAAPIAGVRRARERGLVEAGETVVVVATGSGLKDAAAARRARDDLDPVRPDVDAVLDRY